MNILEKGSFIGSFKNAIVGKLLFVITFLFCVSPALGQQAVIDSLLQKVGETEDPEAKASLYMDLSIRYVHMQSKEANTVLNNAEELLLEIDKDTLWCNFYLKKWFVENFINGTSGDSLKRNFLKGIDYCSSAKDTFSLIQHKFQLSEHYMFAREYEKSYQNTIDIIYLAKSSQDNFSLSAAHIMMGNLNLVLLHDKKAIAEYEKALYYMEAAGLEEKKFTIYGSLTYLYKAQNNQEKLIASCIAGLECFEKYPRYKVYPFLEKFYEFKVLLLSTGVPLEGKYREDLLLDDVLSNLSSIQAKETQSALHSWLGEYYMRNENYDKAQEFLDKALSITKEFDVELNELDILEYLANLAKKKNELEKASKLFEQVVFYNDSIDALMEENAIKISAWESKYAIEDRNKEIVALEQNNNLIATELDNEAKRYNIYIVLFVFVLTVVVFLYIGKRKASRVKEELWAKNQILESHKTALRAKHQNLQGKLETAKERLKGIEMDATKEKYAYSNLSEEDKSEFEDLLLFTIKDEKAFLDPNMTLDKLAEKLEIHRSKLSQIVNEQFNMNFTQLINYYRILEACEYISDIENKDFTLEYIAKKAGFKSMSPFNIAFKKHTGTTPSRYRKDFLKKEKRTKSAQ